MMTEQAVTLIIPVLASQVSLLRLTASGIANQVGFDIDAIEDIKVSLSEVCNKLIEQVAAATTERLEISFFPAGDQLSILFRLPGHNLGAFFDDATDAFALAIIEALMDKVTASAEDGTILLTKWTGRAD